MKSITSIILLVTILLLSSSATSFGKSSAEELYVQGIASAVEGEFSDARDAFILILQSAPFYAPAKVSHKLVNDVLVGRVEQDVAIHLFTGIGHLHNDMYGEGSGELSTALEMDEGNITEYYLWYATAYNNLGVDYIKRGKTTKALFHYTRAVEIEPGYAKAFYNRGLTYIKKKQRGRAIADFSEAIEIDPGYVQAFYNRGLAYAMRRQDQRALADYNEVIEMAPDYGKAYNSRGILFISRLDNRSEGCSDLKIACELGICGAYRFSLKKNLCDEQGETTLTP